MTLYRVDEEFTADLGSRFSDDGDHSGEEFREEHLLGLVAEAISTNTPVRLNFDGCTGMPPSFLEEAFGGLRRARPDWDYPTLERLVIIEAPKRPDLWSWVAFARSALKHGLDQPRRS